jgi:hypothetical protein
LCRIQYGHAVEPVVATLGDARASTCSIAFARTWLDETGGVVLGYASFDEAVVAVLEHDADFVLTPAAWPGLKDLIADPRLVLYDQFRDVVPPIVLCSADAAIPARPPARLYHHAALLADAQRLIEAWGIPVELCEVVSNPAACEAALQDRDAYAITNEIAAEAYAMVKLATLALGRPMPCVVFAVAAGETAVTLELHEALVRREYLAPRTPAAPRTSPND